MEIIWYFLIIMLAHFIADFALQNQFMADHKGKVWFVMFVHCFIWTGTICVALYYFELFSIWKMLFLFTGHYAMDKGKMTFINKKNDLRWFYSDQIFHLLQLAVVTFI